MVKDYKDWKSRISFEASCDGVDESEVVLKSYFGVVEQYLRSPESIACKGILDSVNDCVKNFLKEKASGES